MRLVSLALFSSVENNNKKFRKPSKQVNIFGVYKNKDNNAWLSYYIISRQKKIVTQIVNLNKLITSDTIVTLKKVWSNGKKSFHIIQAYNNQDTSVMLTKFATKVYINLL